MRVAIMTSKCLRIPIDHVNRNIDLGKSINQLIRNVIKPEMIRRSRPPFSAAIIEMFSDKNRKTQVYFDEEAPFLFEFKASICKPEWVGKTDRELGLTMDDVKDISVPDDFGDPNSAKAFIIRRGDTFYLAFDFRYNKQKVRTKLERAREFIGAVRDMDLEKHHYPACYLLWSAVELITDAVMLSMPDAKPTKDHAERLRKLKAVKQKINMVSDDVVTLLGDLEKVKPIARYADSQENVKSRKLRKKMDAAYFRQALAKIDHELESNIILKF